MSISYQNLLFRIFLYNFKNSHNRGKRIGIIPEILDLSISLTTVPPIFRYRDNYIFRLLLKLSCMLFVIFLLFYVTFFFDISKEITISLTMFFNFIFNNICE